MEAKYPDLPLRSSDDVANVFGLVADRQEMDATVQDGPSATFYMAERPELKPVGPAVAPGYYVILTRPEDGELRDKLNAALREGIKDATLRTIYRKYHLWNEDQGRLNYWADETWPPEELPDEEGGKPKVEADRRTLQRAMISKLVEAAWVTVKLACLSMPLAIIIGLLVAVGRLYGPWFVRAPLTVYVEVLRGTPLLLQLYTIFYLLPQFAALTDWPWLIEFVKMPPFVAGVIGLAINYSAYEAENYRAGLLAIPKGQMEAALALGMHPLTALRRVVVPQAVRVVIPPVTNDFIALFKDTSVCSIILITELTRQYNVLFNDPLFRGRDLLLELAFLTAGLYLLMSYPLSLAARRLERRFTRVG
jgi:polar amino acid transport system substrate-binding protein